MSPTYTGLHTKIIFYLLEHWTTVLETLWNQIKFIYYLQFLANTIPRNTGGSKTSISEMIQKRCGTVHEQCNGVFQTLQFKRNLYVSRIFQFFKPSAGTLKKNFS